MTTAPDIAAILAGATGPSGVLKAARQLEPLLAEQPKVALLASFTAELLRPYFVVEAARAGLPLGMWAGPFGQLEQLALEDGSPLYAARPDVIVVMLRLVEVDRRLAEEAAELEPSAVSARLAALRARVVTIARELRRRSSAPLLVANFSIEEPALLFDSSDPDGLGHLVAAENRALARSLREIPDAHVFDYAGAVASIGATRFGDRKLWAISRAIGSSEAHVVVARQLALAARALLRPTHKCIVVDLDNTLWGGVLGDDGAAALKLGDDGAGSLFKDFQAALLGYRRRGLLLAIASKNDEATALEALASQPEMLLRPKHFAATAIGWGPKSEGLRRIATQLNIGLDALVFVDDNPVERAEVRSALPMVHVVELPQDPAGYLNALRALPGLEAPRLEAEDRGRAAMVEHDAARTELAAAAPNLEDFLLGLGMVAEVGQADAATLGRVHQLIQKTNQFNLTTRRHSLEEVRRLAEGDDSIVAWLRLTDRFGDLGLICVGILKAGAAGIWEVDTFLMSCRVMGRHVEDAFLAYLGGLARERGARTLRGLFMPTPKNTPVLGFFEARGFVGAGENQWESNITSDAALPWPAAIARKEHR